ncbi:uncharacterized protein PFL1_01612 [Pseudozyma flocculosa PF-1]|uniref:Zn(2)-C6 fungal-type domain-containing protein n=1 Tax=Pseudozyma flocculosa TaxID=84751 RepID=A0A5C3EYT3_9BASI|nr:uncharacterized protein PFL1_01612 [Pseudozyma flocculosa PF-1]EPQ30711.1 hypothetical protein PFL1_01612 [Pseudozyma flocculosa PF-1]SPO36945.1 uncharacterized protein PSFLO_02416 [Pseudozyma flocculosa]
MTELSSFSATMGSHNGEGRDGARFVDQRSNGNGEHLAQPGPSNDAGNHQHSRKRKKRFKYLLENQSNANGDARDGQSEDPDGNGVDADGKKESRKKVKKACIFCKRSHMPCEEARPCRRCIKRGISDMCRDAEPQGSNGKQAKPTDRAKSSPSTTKGKGRDDDGAAGSPESMSPEPEELDIPGVSARDPDFPPAMSISLLLSPADVSSTRNSQATVYARYAGDAAPGGPAGKVQAPSKLRNGQGPSTPGTQSRRSAPAAFTADYAEAQERSWERNMDYTSQRELMKLLEAGPSAVDLNDAFGDKPTSLLNYPAMIGMPVGESLMMPSAANSPSPVAGGNQGESYDERSRDSSYHVGSTSSLVRSHPSSEMFPRPKHLLQEEHATTAELRGLKSYSYTYGYAKLARWMQTRYSRESCEAVDQCLGQIRPKFLAISRSLPERELLGVEEAFIRLVHHYQANVLEFVPMPTIVSRRTGEVYAANEHAARLLQLPKGLFEGGQISHFQLVPEDEAVKLWRLYADECMGILKDPPVRLSKIEVDRSLLLFNKPGFDPHTGELLGDGSGVCQDGSPVVIRSQALVTFEAKISQHGLPVMVVVQFIPMPATLEGRS